MSRLTAFGVVGMLILTSSCADPISKNGGPVVDTGVDAGADAGVDVAFDMGGEDVGRDVSDLGEDQGIDMRNADAGRDMTEDTGVDMDDPEPLREGWFGLQTLDYGPYQGADASTKMQSSTMALSFLGPEVSADEICGMTMTGHAIVIQSNKQRWEPTAFDFEAEDQGSVLVSRSYVEQEPGVWVVDFSDSPIPITDSAIADRTWDIDMVRPTDYASNSLVTFLGRFENIQGCTAGEEPILNAIAEPNGDDALLPNANLFHAALLPPAYTGDVGLTDSFSSLVYPPTFASAVGSPTDVCGDITAILMTVNSRGSSWAPTAVELEMSGDQNRTVSMTEQSPGVWRRDISPPVTVSDTLDSFFSFDVASPDLRDRWVFRHFWIETANVGPCP